ncbi:glycosyltransferase [Polynucleobacter paneuropaeus]|jgi:glycosyltransferase involved in cell wall biosynthesis|nr:glycosyltransferase [Polynucleobacter paneuropaeus]
MKIGVLDLYSPHSTIFKDPITIPLSFVKAGHSVQLLTWDASVKHAFKVAGLTVMPVSDYMGKGWAGLFDVVVIIGRFSSQVLPIMKEINKANIPIILKGDTDGTLGYPLIPNYLRARPIFMSLMNFLRHIKWRFPSSFLVKKKINQIELVEYLIVESPGAASNVINVLQYWGRNDLISKVRFIQNQISSIAINRAPFQDKSNLVISVGRWDDSMVKGSDLLIRTMVETLQNETNWRFLVVGVGASSLREVLPEKCRKFVDAIDSLSYEELQEKFSMAKILLATSRVESYNLAAAEALCAGASLVVTPIESLVYLAGGGEYGNVARGFSSKELTASLTFEMSEWERGERNPSEISNRSRKLHDPDSVIKKWQKILASTKDDKKS